MSSVQIRLSEQDERRFGVRTAQIRQVSAGDVERIDDDCRERGVRLAVVRLEARQMDAVQELEEAGFRLMDTLLVYRRDVQRDPIRVPDAPVVVREAVAADIEGIGRVARVCFAGYPSHYRANPRLSDEDVDEVYVDWATRSLSDPALAGWVRVAEVDGRVAGFVTARMNSAEEGEVVLAGIAPEARRKGIYEHFLVAGAHWCREQGAHGVILVTQVTNTVVQRVYANLGFRVLRGEYTLHKWFE